MISLQIVKFLNLILAAIVGGMYWGPWLALTRSLKEFEPAVFLVIVNKLNKNMAPLMTVLSPLSILIGIPVLIILYKHNLLFAFYFTLSGWLCFILAILVTVIIEVPIVKQIVSWTESSLPENWEVLRDKWRRFHLVRIAAGITGLIFYLIALL